MKHLFVVRHAKSSWSDPGLADFDRPLNKRGFRDAPRMGRFLKKQGVRPDRLVSSPAKRAWTTAGLIAEELGYPAREIVPEPLFYGAGVRDTLSIVRTFDDAWVTAMIFGHNPTTTSFVNSLVNEELTNVPTCGVAHIAFESTSWTHLGNVAAELLAFWVPKEIR